MPAIWEDLCKSLVAMEAGGPSRAAHLKLMDKTGYNDVLDTIAVQVCDEGRSIDAGPSFRHPFQGHVLLALASFRFDFIATAAQDVHSYNLHHLSDRKVPT